MLFRYKSIKKERHEMGGNGTWDSRGDTFPYETSYSFDEQGNFEFVSKAKSSKHFYLTRVTDRSVGNVLQEYERPAKDDSKQVVKVKLVSRSEVVVKTYKGDREKEETFQLQGYSQ